MMNRRQLAPGFLGVLLASLDRPAAATTVGRPVAPVVGAWRLIDAATVLADGREVDLDGRRGPYTGLILYTSEGVMAVQIASARETLDPATPFDRVPDRDRLRFLDTYEAYFGTYDIDVAAGIVRHHCETSLDPTGPGLVYTRRFSIAGDILTIRTSADANITNDGHYNRLRWKRVTAVR
jgi:Lipocalin-like domain